MPSAASRKSCKVAVIWIDWYPYHVARFRGLESAPSLRGAVAGVELVGGVGVHKGLKFREELPADLWIETLMPEASWATASKTELARRVWRKLDELQPEVVLVPGYYTLPAIAAALWARVHGRTSVLMTESTAADHARSWWKELPKKLALRALFDWAVCGGKAHVAYLHQLGFAADRIAGCYDVVDNGLFRDGALALRGQRESAPVDGPFFLYVGRLAEEKNVAGLLASWTAYRTAGGTWPLVLCGDGPERAALAQTAAHTPFAQYVHFPGLKTSQQLLPFYAHAGAFVLPSTREPWGLVVNEAMAAELPVLVSDRCGCSFDLVEDGANGFLFPPQDQAALQGHLHALEAMSGEDRARMGRRSGEILRHFSPEGFGKSIAGVLAARGGAAQAALATEVAS